MRAARYRDREATKGGPCGAFSREDELGIKHLAAQLTALLNSLVLSPIFQIAKPLDLGRHLREALKLGDGETAFGRGELNQQILQSQLL